MNPWLVRHITFPLHQRLKRRSTLEWFGRLRESERWDALRLRTWQEERLRTLLRHANQNVPYYHDLFKEKGIDVEASSLWREWNHIPILSKGEVRKQFERLQARDRRRESVQVQTSGSTGVPVAWNVNRLADDIHLAVKLRNRNWWGFKPGDRHFWLWGRDEFVGWRKVLLDEVVWNRQVLPVLALSGKTVHLFFDRIKRGTPRFLIWISFRLSAVCTISQGGGP